MSVMLRRIFMGLVFFAMALGLGYPTLNRYQPSSPGLGDAVSYAEMTEKGTAAMNGDDHWHQRVMVPFLAHQIYRVVQDRLGSWSVTFFALLVVNAAFCALTALVLLALGQSMLGNSAAGLIAALLFLLNFNTSNLYLAGLVDSGELFFVVALLWALWNGKWAWLFAIVAVGVWAKETFLAYSLMLAGGWWLAQIPARGMDKRHFLAVAAMLLAGVVSLSVLLTLLHGHFTTPFTVVASEYHPMSWSDRIGQVAGLPLSRQFWYTFAWLLPLGVMGIGALPRTFIVASLLCLAGTMVLSVWGDAGNNIGRPLFDAVGPLLCLGASRTMLTLAKG